MRVRSMRTTMAWATYATGTTTMTVLRTGPTTWIEPRPDRGGGAGLLVGSMHQAQHLRQLHGRHRDRANPDLVRRRRVQQRRLPMDLRAGAGITGKRDPRLYAGATKRDGAAMSGERSRNGRLGDASARGRPGNRGPRQHQRAPRHGVSSGLPRYRDGDLMCDGHRLPA